MPTREAKRSSTTLTEELGTKSVCPVPSKIAWWVSSHWLGGGRTASISEQGKPGQFVTIASRAFRDMYFLKALLENY
jgi:hypothetical protein